MWDDHPQSRQDDLFQRGLIPENTMLKAKGAATCFNLPQNHVVELGTHVML